MVQEVNPMRSNKRRYTKPQLNRHGDVDEITKKGGSTFVDVPIGDPVDDDISNIAS